MRKLWVTVVTHTEDGGMLFKGVGATAEAAHEALLREVVATLSDDGNEPMTLDDAQDTIEEQLFLVEPFEIEVPDECERMWRLRWWWHRRWVRG
jgi:hypothetical protein